MHWPRSIFSIRKKAPKPRLRTFFQFLGSEVILSRALRLLRLYNNMLLSYLHYFKMNPAMSLVQNGSKLQSVKLIPIQQAFNKPSVLYNIHNYCLLKPAGVTLNF